MIKRVASFLIVIGMVFMMVACGGSSQTPSTGTNTPSTGNAPSTGGANSGEQKETRRIGYGCGPLDNPIVQEMLQGCENWFLEKGITTTPVSFGDDTSKLRNLIESLVQAGVSGIVLHASGLRDEMIEPAVEAGVPVVIISSYLETAVCNLVQDEFPLGQVCGDYAGQWIRDNLDGKCKYATNSIEGWIAGVLRMDGMKAGVAKYAPEAVLVNDSPVNNTEMAMSWAESVMLANPDLKCFVVSGDGIAIGVVEALIAGGYDMSDMGVFCVDATEQGLQYIKDGTALRMSVSLSGGRVLGALAAENLFLAMEGGTPEKNIPVPTTPVDINNVEEMAEFLGYNLK